jgi:hypothetical protein
MTSGDVLPIACVAATDPWDQKLWARDRSPASREEAGVSPGFSSWMSFVCFVLFCLARSARRRSSAAVEGVAQQVSDGGGVVVLEVL